MDKQCLRILFLITDLGKGGAERFLVDLCTELQKRDDVKFIIGTLFNNNQYAGLTDSFEIVNLNYTTYSFLGKNEYPAYKKILKEFEPHVVHTHLYLAEFLSSFYVSKDIKYICHGHDNTVQLANFSIKNIFNKKSILNFIEKNILIRKKYKRAKSYFITNSEHTHQYYNNVLPTYLRPHITLIHCGFNYNRFYKKSPNIIPVNSTINLINIGSYQDKKNQIFIVEIARELIKTKMDFTIHLLGDGANRKKVQASVDRNGLSERVILHGNVNNVEEWVWKSHIYLHAAWYEPFGLVFLEAMAAGLPCVALDGKGNRDLIEEGKNGYLISEQNPKQFSEAIVELVNNKEKYSEISKYAKISAEKYEISLKAEEHMIFYNSCL